jgi:hypothetical protein
MSGDVELMLGDYFTELAERSWNTATLDMPYSERTHKGHDAGVANASMDGHTFENRLGYDDRYVFAPIPYVDLGKAPRVLGDGPASWTVFVVVSRPRSKAWLSSWRDRRRALELPRSLPGAYLRSAGDTVYRPEDGKALQGAKPLGVMRALVRDYSFAGDLVCDPTAGHGTTPLAAAQEARRALGCEIDEATHAEATRRLGLGFTRDMWAELPAAPGWAP